MLSATNTAKCCRFGHFLFSLSQYSIVRIMCVSSVSPSITSTSYIESSSGRAKVYKIAIDSISIHKPTLEDVFLHFTGRTIREEEANIKDRMRIRGRMHR